MSSIRNILFIGVIIRAYALLQDLTTASNVSLSPSYTTTQVPYHNDSALKNTPRRIISGKRVKIQQYPFMVALVLEKEVSEYLCGGSIIGKTWVLTAAHCFHNYRRQITDDDIKNRRVYIHGNSSKWNKDYERHLVVKFYNHIRYKVPLYDYDISVVKVIEPFIGKHEKCIRLAGIFYKYRTYSVVLNLSWRLVSQNVTSVDHLREAKIYIAPQRACKQAVNGVMNMTVAPRMTCAFRWEQTIFPGDSGGMLYQHGSLIGLTSFGLDRVSYVVAPEVFTRISWFGSFIRKIVGKNVCRIRRLYGKAN